MEQLKKRCTTLQQETTTGIVYLVIHCKGSRDHKVKRLWVMLIGAAGRVWLGLGGGQEVVCGWDWGGQHSQVVQRSSDITVAASAAVQVVAQPPVFWLKAKSNRSRVTDRRQETAEGQTPPPPLAPPPPPPLQVNHCENHTSSSQII